MTEIQKVKANGLEFAYLSYGEGPLVICLHGFPDSAHTWDQLGPRIAELGYRVVAPFMRGYHPTALPADDLAYTALDLGGDVVALIKQFGFESAIVIGHDWGALASYAAANLEANAVSKLITLAIPHPRSIKPSLRGLWKARHFITFQFRGSARRMISKGDFSGVDQIYKRWSPTWSFPASETAYIKNTFKDAARLDAALAYYWAFREANSGEKAQTVGKVVNAKTSVPTLCLVGDADGALDLSLMEQTPRCYTGEYTYMVVPNVGHFLHRENPDVIFEHISAFLRG